MPTPSRLPQVKQLPVQSPLKGINRVVGRESQTPDYCWDAVNVFPFDANGRAIVAQRFGVGKAWGVPLGSTQIQGLLPVNYIAYSSTGQPNSFPVTIVPVPGIPGFSTPTYSSGTITPTAPGGSGVIGGGPPFGSIGGTPGGTPSTSTGGGPRRPGQGPGGSGGPGGPIGPGTFPFPSTSPFPSTTLPALFGGPTAPPRFGGPGGQGGPGNNSGPGSGGTVTGTGATSDPTFTAKFSTAGVTNEITAQYFYQSITNTNRAGIIVKLDGDGFLAPAISTWYGTQAGIIGTPVVFSLPTGTSTRDISFHTIISGPPASANITITVTDQNFGGTSTLVNTTAPNLGAAYVVTASMANTGPTSTTPGSYLTSWQ